MINTSTYLFAQVTSSPYTFKYILKPKYKTRLHIPIKLSEEEVDEMNRADAAIASMNQQLTSFDEGTQANKDSVQSSTNLTKEILMPEFKVAVENRKAAIVARKAAIKDAIPHEIKDFFDILFLGTGYNRNFNMSDVVYDDPKRYKYDIEYTPAYWRLDTANRNFTLFSDMDDLIRIRDIDFVKRNYLLPGVIFLKFNHSTKTFDIDDISKIPPKITPANNLLLPTYKRKWNFTNNVSDDDSDNHKKYLKFKYGIDVLYKKGQILTPTSNPSSNPLTITMTDTSSATVTMGATTKSIDSSIITTKITIPGVGSTTTESKTTGMIPYSIVGKGNTTFSHPALKCYVLNKINGSDTMMIVPWFRRHVSVHNKKNGLKLMNDKNSLEFKDEVIAKDVYLDTFYFVIPNNYNTKPYKNSNYNKFNMEFNTKYFIPVSITFQEIGFSFHRPVILQSNFISAGMAYGWAHGKTTFFKNDNNTQKNFYLGAGFLGSLSAASDTSKANKGSMVPALSLGVHVVVAISSIQILAAGGYGFAFEDTQTQWGRQGEAWVGFGIGLNLFTLIIPTVASAAGGK